MKQLSSCIICFLLFPALSSAQSFQWVYSNEANYNQNPALPTNMVCTSNAGKVYDVYFYGDKFVYGSDIYGTDHVDCYTTDGDLQWTITLGSRALANRTVADDDGNLYIFGSFMKSLVIDGSDSLENTGSNFSVNLFLLCIDPNGNLVWKRNLSEDHPGYYIPGAIALDHDQKLWYALSDFSGSIINETDASGNDLTSYYLAGSKMIGGISFDAQHNLFVAGATTAPTLTVVNLDVNVPETYMMFVARINAAGEGSWAELASDVTFQRPEVKADNSGNAFVSGTLMVATSFGSVSFMPPQWVYDVFLTRVDSNGNFLWGVQAPQDPGGITGDFARGVNSFITIDAENHVYLTGDTRGTLDWGNGVMSEATSISLTSLTIISFDENGTALWARNGGSEEFNQASAIAINDAGEIFFSAAITGNASFDTISVNNGGDFASVIGKLDPGVATSASNFVTDDLIHIYPNPFTQTFQVAFNLPAGKSSVELIVFDLAGKEMERHELPAHETFLSLSAADYTAGVYLLEVRSEGQLLHRAKLIKAE
ncbi:MAG: T9SS type A sorting domain-containing protein [Chitinophagales bacterium]|nr:T9SS type A sorting domain-containing protein [Chitinophagales bacterium]